MNKLLTILMMVPGIIQGIENIHGNAISGADKKTLALQSLGLASAAASVVTPSHKAEIDAYTEFASNLIDQTVTLLKSTKQMAPTNPAPATE